MKNFLRVFRKAQKYNQRMCYDSLKQFYFTISNDAGLFKRDEIIIDFRLKGPANSINQIFQRVISEAIIPKNEYYNSQRISIYHKHNSLSNPNRHIRIDGRLFYEELRFSITGEKEMEKLVKRNGFDSIRSFFLHYYNIMDGQMFEGLIMFKDGYRYFAEEDL